jgi:choline dehydrogenase-like flavoprotein
VSAAAVETLGTDAMSQVWDAVVIGTGAGGATAGYALARQGKSVLFVERGLGPADSSVVRGRALTRPASPEETLRHGWWPDMIQQVHGQGSTPRVPTFGCVAGGSTALFAMVMDRLRPSDFTPRRYHSDAPSSSLPEAWPITYEELEPHYAAAERLYRICGTPDPLQPPTALLDPPPPTAKEAAFTDALATCGLHPYRIHYAQSRVEGCYTCPAMLCPRACRVDAVRACLQPALDLHAARLLPECRVVRLEERGRDVRQAICEWQGREIAVRGRVFLLAANAVLTPALLERSANERFPNGLANSSGLVGRNLMMHVSDTLLLTLKRPRPALGPELTHGVSFNDFYEYEGEKLGNVHAHGVPITGDAIFSFMRTHRRELDRVPTRIVRQLAKVGARLNRPSVVFSTLLEDLPYDCNRVRAAGDTAAFEYRTPHELRMRAWRLYSAVEKRVGARFGIRPLRGIGSLNSSHACGTCRFGDDPTRSVLDRDNRAHDLGNLYVVDGSFLPSSGGMNPSLTIAANALRVADTIARRI